MVCIKIAAGLLSALVLVMDVGCGGGKTPQEPEREIAPFTGYREFTRISVEETKLTGEWDESRRLDVIDLEDQFYPLSELTVTVPEDMEQAVCFLDSGESVIGGQELQAGANPLSGPEGTRYLVFPMAAEDRGRLQYQGTLGAEAAKEREEGCIVSETLNGKRLSVLGDSLSSAVDYSPDGIYGTYPLGDAEVTDIWWYQVAKAFDMEICCINAYGGSGVTDRLGRPETAAGAGGRGRQLDANGEMPEVIIVWIGANDALQGVPMDTIRKAYRKMLEDIKECYPSAELYLATYYLIDSEELRQLNQVIRGLGEEYGAQILDMEGCDVAKQEGALADGSHPGREGCRIVAEYMEELLRK